MAEFIGTFVLVFSATAPIVLDAQTGSVGILGIAFSPAIGVGLMVYAFAKTSGAHFNPAVSLGFLINRTITLKEFASYLSAQITGGILASIFVLYTIGAEAHLGANYPNNDIGLVEILIVEALLSFLLMGVIIASVHTRGLRGLGGMAIGLIIGLDILFGNNISGASMNPARSLAPALISGNTTDLWIYLTMPLLGSILAIYTYEIVKRKTPVSRKE